MEEQLKIKVIIVGDSGVGKTNLRTRFCHGTYEIKSDSTVGIQFSRRKFWAPIETKNNRLFTVCFWDAAGKFNENQLMPAFFKNVMGVIYVFDMTKQESLENLKMWKGLIGDHLNVNKVTEILLGNKNDLVFLREVSIYEAEKFKKEMKIPLYFETSALQNININQAFYAFLSEIAKEANKGMKLPLKLKKKENSSRCFY